MQEYVGFVVALHFIVELLLLLGAGRLCGYPITLLRCAIGAVLSALYSGVCLLNDVQTLGMPLCRGVSIIIVVATAYGIHRNTLRPAALYAVLLLALQGIATGMGDGGVISFAFGILVLGILCYFGFRGRAAGNVYIPVEIRRGDVCLTLTALQDTGNMLRDPVTGQSVLVIGAEAAAKLTGLTREQLLAPIESITAIPGLQLIPYHCVGKANGFLLAMKFQNVRIGDWTGNSLVAFAPEGLGGEGSYDALTGGML